MNYTEDIEVGSEIVTVHYFHDYEPGKHTLPNGDPGYPPSEEFGIKSVIYKDVDILQLLENLDAVADMEGSIEVLVQQLSKIIDQ